MYGDDGDDVWWYDVGVMERGGDGCGTISTRDTFFNQSIQG